MDRRNMALDNLNIRSAASETPAIPTFSLYGEREDIHLGDWLHCEPIAARSGLNAWEIRPHRHRSYFQILYQSGGFGECIIENVRSRLWPPSVVMAPPGAVHGFRFGEDVQGWVVTVVGEKVLAAAETAPEIEGLFAWPQVIDLTGREAAAAIDTAFAVISSEFSGRRPARGALIDAQLRSVLVLLARLAEPGRGAHAPAALGRAAQFRELLDSHYREQWSVGSYALKLGVSQTHLNRVCRAAFGKTALGVIRERVVLEASRDLALTTMTVQDIGRSLGFDDAAYFSRLFSKAVGASPISFRKRVRARQN